MSDLGMTPSQLHMLSCLLHAYADTLPAHYGRKHLMPLHEMIEEVDSYLPEDLLEQPNLIDADVMYQFMLWYTATPDWKD